VLRQDVLEEDLAEYFEKTARRLPSQGPDASTGPHRTKRPSNMTKYLLLKH